jgi:hypothetical protein
MESSARGHVLHKHSGRHHRTPQGLAARQQPLRQQYEPPTVSKVPLTNGYGPDHRRLVAEFGDGPYRAITTMEEAVAKRFGLAPITVAHVDEPPFAGMEIALEGTMTVQLIRQMSQHDQTAPKTGEKWCGRPLDKTKRGARQTAGLASREKNHPPRHGHH